MCGFLQVFQKNKRVEPRTFESALATMKHRGPDDTGVTYGAFLPPGQAAGEEVFYGLGHQRLSILDLDKRSAQPFERENYSLLFNGEIYNYQDLREELEVEFQTNGDTEVLLRVLEKHGKQGIDLLNGMWAFSLFDQKKGHILASKDRYGKKPLFYYMDDSTLLFSSTIGAINSYLKKSPCLRRDALDVYLHHGVMYPSGNCETHFHEIKQVLPGHVVTFDLAEWTIAEDDCYDDFMLRERPTPPSEQLPDLLKDAVSLRLVSDRPVGLMLSGGIDSTLVLSVLHSMGLHEQVQCYIGDTGKSPDAEYAKKCAGALGVKSRVINLDYGDEAFNIFLRMCSHHEKAFPLVGNAMAMAEMYHRISEDSVPVVIDGTGGDEVFGGYWDRSFEPAVRQAFKTGDYEWIKNMKEGEPALSAQVKKIMGAAVLRNRLWNINPKQARRRRQLSHRLLGLHRTGCESTDPLSSPSSNMTEDLIKDISPGGRIGEWIWHTDRNAMMSGVENRSPLLDYRLRDFIRTGYRSKMHEGWNKYELRKVFDQFTKLPSQWRRQKQGFRWDRKNFLRKNKASALELIAESKCLSEYYDTAAFVERAMKDDRVYLRSLTTRLLCIAGLEETLNMSPSDNAI